MKRALAIGLVLVATSASASVLAPGATRVRDALGRKPQWAPSGNFSALHGRAVFPSETRSGPGAYAREGRETAAAKRIWSYANLNPGRYVDPDGRCVFQSCSELWNELTGTEAPMGPQPATAIGPAAPRAPAEFDWEASEDRKMRERFDYYLYRQQAPSSPELLGWGEREAQKQQWEAQRTQARNVVEGMQTVENVSRLYLREVAAPYLIAEGGGLFASKVGGAVGRAVVRDLAAETQAAKELARIEGLEKFMAAQKSAPTLPLRDAQFGALDAYASANRRGLDTSYRGAASQEAKWNVEEAQRIAGGKEGRVDTFDELDDLRVRGDNLTPHHVPSDAYMSKAGPADYTRGEGIAIWLEQTPVGGRHRRTISYGRSPNLSVSPRDTLAREAWDVRQRFREDGLYTPANRSAIQELIERNKERWGSFFEKK